jgi:hypothetical protein
MFPENIRRSSECAKNIGFTCSGSGKERGDAGKAWAMFWLQKCLNTPCLFGSGDYLAVVATTAPGLVWGIVVNSIVTVWVSEGQRPPINQYELGKIKAFVKGARSMVNPYEFFISRINMLLEYQAFTFIHDIISLIRAPPHGTDDSEHVALETILILCAALSTIVSSVELNINEDDRFVPVVSIKNDYYDDITPELFDKLVPQNPESIDEIFCHQNGIYGRESYFRKVIPLDALDDALNQHSAALFAYDYVSSYTDKPLQTTNMKKIFTLHCPQFSAGNSKGKRKFVLGGEDELKCLTKLNETFHSLDVLCIAKMIRSDQSSVPHVDNDNYNDWFSTLCTNKLTEFLNRTHCKEIFCKLVQFKLPQHLGGVNRLQIYLASDIFPAETLLCQQKESVMDESINMGDSDEKPYPDTNPKKFVEGIETAQTCSKEAYDKMWPPLPVDSSIQTHVQMTEFLKYLTDSDSDSDSELFRIISEGYYELLKTPREIRPGSSPRDIALAIIKKKYDKKDLEKSYYKTYNGQIHEHIKRFNKLRRDLTQGGSPTHTRTRRKLARNHRRTQYTNKHKRSSKVTKRATIKHRKSYRKHNRTVKRRKSRRHH